jgi:hypothetical protein
MFIPTPSLKGIAEKPGLLTSGKKTTKNAEKNSKSYFDDENKISEDASENCEGKKKKNYFHHEESNS